MGVNLGDVIVEDGDIFGDGVNVAARLESIAPIGGIAVSQSVRDHVGKRLDLVFEDMGERRLKNIEAPIRVYTHLARSIAAARRRPASGRQRERPSVAVLPFVNMSGDPEQEYFSDGITEDIITDLGESVGPLRRFAQHRLYLQRKTRRRAGSRQAAQGQLHFGRQRAKSGRARPSHRPADQRQGRRQVWADRYDRDLTDIFAIQDEITNAIVEPLKVKLLPRKRSRSDSRRPRTSKPTLFISGGRQFLHRHSKSYLSTGAPHVRQSRRIWIRLYARAYAGIADCDSFLFPPLQRAGRDRRLSSDQRESSRLGRTDWPKRTASRGLALSLDERYDEATAEFEKAIALDPNSFEGALLLCAAPASLRGNLSGRPTLFERAAEIKPDDYQSVMLLIQIYHSLGPRRKIARVRHAAVLNAPSAN